MAKLAIMTGKLQGQKMSLPEKDITIGRDDTCAIRLSGTEISRRHCQLRFVGGQITAKDLGSRNGSYVNDVKILEETVLKHGDLLRVGSMVFKVESDPARTETPIGKTKSDLAKSESAKHDATRHESSKPLSKSKSPDYDQMVEVHSPSEDSIVNWLVDDASGGGDASDTTIVPQTVEMSAAQANVSQPSAPNVAPSAATKKQFASVKEEAADIIRRHFESLKAS